MRREYEAEAGASMPVKPSSTKELIPSEDSEQFRVVDWLRWKRVLCHHSPNGGERPSKVKFNKKLGQMVRYSPAAGKLARQGTATGFPDLIILEPPPAMPGIHAVAIEMKRRQGGKVTEEQKRWLLLPRSETGIRRYVGAPTSQ